MKKLFFEKKRYLFYILFIVLNCYNLQAQDDVDDEEETEEADSTFDDYLTSIGFFDTSMIPKGDNYPIWSTTIIHPNGQDLSRITDTTEVILVNGKDLIFHPPCFGGLTSGFGYRQMRRSRGRMHYGTDIKLYTGDPVYAVFDGVVRIAKYSPSYGYVVVVRHFNGLETVYAHFSKLLAMPGIPIRAGQPIGLGGSTGHSYGSHLHFEMRFKGLAFDATKVIDFEKGKLYHDTIYIDSSYFLHLKHKKHYSGKSSKNAKYYTIRKGDTLGAIAQRNRVSVSQICRLNGISKNSIIRPGKKLRLR